MPANVGQDNAQNARKESDKERSLRHSMYSIEEVIGLATTARRLGSRASSGSRYFMYALNREILPFWENFGHL